jgi:hypothetical protein
MFISQMVTGMNKLLLLLAIVAAGCCGIKESARPSELDEPSLQVLQEAGFDPASIRCNSHAHWGPDLGKYSDTAAVKIAEAWSVELDDTKRRKAARVVLSYLVRSMFEMLKPNNLGVVALEGRYYVEDGKRRQLLVFRSGLMTDAEQPDSCMRSLIEKARVRHVVNLYAGTFPLHDFIATEARVAKEMGVSYHNEAEIRRPWRDLIEHKEDYQRNLDSAMRAVADLINTQILNPGGKPPRGNILIHCAGGMHRTGMTYGILQRCINQDPMEEIEICYKCHTAFKSEREPAGYEELNLQFIRDFDCGLLK